jgi:hypothetical protein
MACSKCEACVHGSWFVYRWDACEHWSVFGYRCYSYDLMALDYHGYSRCVIMLRCGLGLRANFYKLNHVVKPFLL